MKTTVAMAACVLLISSSAFTLSPSSGIEELTADPLRGSGTSTTRYVLDVDRTDFDSVSNAHQGAARELVDIEILWDGSEERYSGIFRPVATGVTVHKLIQQSPTTWSTFLSNMIALNGRFLDLEVGYFDGQKLYSAIFLEDGDDYGFAIYSTNSDASFQVRLAEQLALGRQLIDFESYVDNSNNVRYAGIWVADPNQPMTHLYYGLRSNEFSDLLSPLAGRVLDIERYTGPSGVGSRFALLVAQVEGGEWGVYRGQSAASISTRNSQIGDHDTDLIDIDFFQSAGTYFDAVWGSAPKSLEEVGSMPSEPDFSAPSSALQALFDDFESGSDGGTGELGVYARNLRSDQSTGQAIDQPLYLASLSKTAIHIKLFREAQAGRLNWTTTTPYTNSPSRRDPWWVDDRSTTNAPGHTTATPIRPGFGPPHFGQWFSLARFDQAMMQVSDNGATSMLVDDGLHGVANDAENVNEWLASLPGVGPEFGLVTSIQDVDRYNMWQGQQDPTQGFLDEISYLAPPPSTLTGYSRANDRWCDMADFLNDNYGQSASCLDVTGYPRRSFASGVSRYLAMGLNSASPRAVGNLYEDLWEGDLLNPSNTAAALGVMLRTPASGSRSTSFDNNSNFPNGIQIFSKGGRKSRWGVETEGGIMVMGPDAISLTILSGSNSRTLSCGTANDVACRFGDIAYRTLLELGTDLVVSDSSIAYEQAEVGPGDAFDASCVLFNLNGGDAQAFDVGFYASAGVLIKTNDHLIGTVRIDGLDGLGSVRADLNLDNFPSSIPPGDYHVGCIADPRANGDAWGEVGEINESIDSNNSDASPSKLSIVSTPTGIFADGFESGNTSAWIP